MIQDVNLFNYTRLLLKVKINIILASMSLLCLTTGGCGNYGVRDVSNDASYGNFAAVRGTYKTKIDLYLVRDNGTDKRLGITTHKQLYDPNDGGLRILPIGTEIRVECLIKKVTLDTEFCYVTGSLVVGQYAGNSLDLDSAIFINNAVIGNLAGPFPKGKLGWDVNPDILEK